MSKVRVLVGTRKGAFILTSDGKRKDWNVSGPHFAGWEIYHLKGSPVDQNRIYASQTSGWFGQVMQRSNDGGRTWKPQEIKNSFTTGIPGTHQWYDGTPHPWEFKRVWHIEPSLTDADTVYAGIEDAALFSSTDGAQNWQELSGLRKHGTGPQWHPAPVECVCTRSFSIRATRSGSSSPSPPRGVPYGRRRRDVEADQSGAAVATHSRPCRRRGPLRSPHRHAPLTPGRALHAETLGRDAELTTRGDSWQEVSGNLPTDFGFAIDVHAHEPETIYVVPIKSDSEHYPPDGKLRVYRSRTGGNEWEPLTKGLPQSDCYVNVLRDAMAVDSLDSCGVYFGTTGGQVYASSDAGDTWAPIVRDLPAVLSVEVQTLS